MDPEKIVVEETPPENPPVDPTSTPPVTPPVTPETPPKVEKGDPQPKPSRLQRRLQGLLAEKSKNNAAPAQAPKPHLTDDESKILDAEVEKRVNEAVNGLRDEILGNQELETEFQRLEKQYPDFDRDAVMKKANELQVFNPEIVYKAEFLGKKVEPKQPAVVDTPKTVSIPPTEPKTEVPKTEADVRDSMMERLAAKRK